MKGAITRAEPSERWKHVVAFEADVCSGDLLVEIFHGGLGGQDAILSNQAADLGPKGDECDEIDNRQRAEEEPTHQKMLWRLDVIAPEQASDGGKESAMGRDETVGAFGDSRKSCGMDVPIEKPLFMRVGCECPDCSFSAGVNGSVGFDEVDCGFKLLEWDFGIARRNRRVLKRQIVQAVACRVSPTPNPDAAEGAVAIINHEWLRRRSCDLVVGFHFGSNS